MALRPFCDERQDGLSLVFIAKRCVFGIGRGTIGGHFRYDAVQVGALLVLTVNHKMQKRLWCFAIFKWQRLEPVWLGS